MRHESNTQWAKCNTIFRQLSANMAFDINNITHDMRDRIQARLEKAQIDAISVDEFIEHYRQEDDS